MVRITEAVQTEAAQITEEQLMETDIDQTDQVAFESETSVQEEVPHKTSVTKPHVGFHTESYNEFNYKPVPVLAVVGLVLAFISFMGVFVWLVMPLCLIALGISTASLVSIRRSHGAYGGTLVAIAGMFLSVLFFSGGLVQQIYTFQTEVPEGYERLSFLKDISEKGFVEKDGATMVHPDIQALDGKQVFVKGFIYQTGKTEGLTSFLMVKDNQDCCFGGKPALEDRLGVIMKEGKSINYHAGKVAISGTFRLNPDYHPENNLAPVFIIEGEIFSKWVSDF